MSSPPPMVVCKMEAQSEYVHVAYTFLHVWHPICVVSRWLLTKFQHQSSVESSLRVHCRLGLSPRLLLWLLVVHVRGEGVGPPPLDPRRLQRDPDSVLRHGRLPGPRRGRRRTVRVANLPGRPTCQNSKRGREQQNCKI